MSSSAESETKSTTQEQMNTKDGMGIYRALAAVCVRPSKTSPSLQLSCKVGEKEDSTNNNAKNQFFK